jgi:hypothetical protein
MQWEYDVVWFVIDLQLFQFAECRKGSFVDDLNIPITQMPATAPKLT